MNVFEKLGFKSNEQKKLGRLEQEAEKIGEEIESLKTLQRNVEMGMEMQSGASGEARGLDRQQLEGIREQLIFLENRLREVGRQKLELEK